MALNQCKECGNLFRSDIDLCPNCETPVKREKSRAGYLGIIGFILLVGLFSIQMNAYFQKRSVEKERLKKEEAVALQREQREQEEQEEASRMKAVEDDYQKIVSLWQDGKYDQASNDLSLFSKYNQPDYRNVSEIEKNLEIHKLEQELKTIPASRASVNLAMYKKLLSLEPDKVKYKKKVIYYTKKIKKTSSQRKGRKKQTMALTKEGKNKKRNTEKAAKGHPVQEEESMGISELVEEAPF